MNRIFQDIPKNINRSICVFIPLPNYLYQLLMLLNAQLTSAYDWIMPPKEVPGIFITECHLKQLTIGTTVLYSHFLTYAIRT